ncbi:CRISPR-associated protein Csx18 [Oxynema aestuarii]|uniref:Uncharacterized protein n=1 Tax=Oxynema aestuarii AP17 TaxID=2064643 RepID=A0A6H1TYK8_9CYAN|nr:CRISPR-associated protein Csx18 [Oxynema aestuarii]QIZ71671.1 hypothetical protein HCG48_14645 [Oxynema aestuarii AP17]
MYLTYRSALVRNISVAALNGLITLVILLIAPLGLAAVIGNTFLITLASFFTGTFADVVVRYLQPSHPPRSVAASLENDSALGQRHPNHLDHQ